MLVLCAAKLLHAKAAGLQCRMILLQNDFKKSRDILGLATHLFVKVPQLGDSEGTFSVLSQAATCY